MRKKQVKTEEQLRKHLSAGRTFAIHKQGHADNLIVHVLDMFHPDMYICKSWDLDRNRWAYTVRAWGFFQRHMEQGMLFLQPQAEYEKGIEDLRNALWEES